MIHFDEPRTATLHHVQTRVEKHGEDDVAAIDLVLSVTSGNQILDEVAPGLRAALFTAHAKQASKKAQGEMDLPVDDMPHLRAPALVPPLRLDCEIEGATVVIGNGIDETTAIQLNQCRVHKVRVTAIEGGSSEVKFSVSSASGIDAQIVGTLSMKQQQEVELTLVGPKADDKSQAKADGDGEGAWPFPKKGRKGKTQDAGDIFAEQHGGASA